MEDYEEGVGQVRVAGVDSLGLEYERKLEEYIEEKEKNILAVNAKKSGRELGNVVVQTGDPMEGKRKV